MTAENRIRMVLDTLAMQGASSEEIDYALDELLDEVREDLIAEETAVKPREGVAAEEVEVVAC